jgi:hypothetical protein
MGLKKYGVLKGQAVRKEIDDPEKDNAPHYTIFVKTSFTYNTQPRVVWRTSHGAIKSD